MIFMVCLDHEHQNPRSSIGEFFLLLLFILTKTSNTQFWLIITGIRPIYRCVGTDKCVITADGSMIGNILIILKGSFLVRSIKGTFVTYYDIPLRGIKQILGNCVTLHPFKNVILQKYMKSTKRIWEE